MIAFPSTKNIGVMGAKKAANLKNISHDLHS